jgi:hypothetical protein
MTAPRRLFRLAGLSVALAGLTAVAADAPKSKQDMKKELRQKLLAAKEAREAKEQQAEAAPAKTTPVVKRSVTQPKDPAALAKLIDQRVDAKLAAEKVPASPACSDSEFVRRVYLDLTGVIPPADKAREFLESTAPDKRAKLVDALLADPAYGKHLADLWEPRLIPEDSMNRFVPRQPFGEWLAKQFNDNTPWDQFVASLVSATGTIEDNPAVSYFLLNRTVDKLTDGVSRNFLGVQLQCAQCHNHPFTDTKQAEYWGMATFFSKVSPQRPGNPTRTGADPMKLGVTEGAAKNRQKDFFPEAAKTVPAKFLGGDEPKLSASEPYRPALAAWLTSADNPWFAKAMVNRTWGQLFGAGIIDPVDDLDGEHEASHPELLEDLGKAFAGSGFDLKTLVRGICLSDAYQRTSKPAKGNEADERLLSHRTVKVMTAEQLFDSIARVVGFNPADEKKGGAPAQVKGVPNGPREQFVKFYLAGAEVANPTEYEAGIPQALRLMNSKMGGGLGALRAMIEPGMRPAEMIDAIYLATLSRKPTSVETYRLLSHVAKAKTPVDGMGDVLWAVLNSSEFTMVR